jgi:hypothetical protein
MLPLYLSVSRAAFAASEIFLDFSHAAKRLKNYFSF